MIMNVMFGGMFASIRKTIKYRRRVFGLVCSDYLCQACDFVQCCPDAGMRNARTRNVGHIHHMENAATKSDAVLRKKKTNSFQSRCVEINAINGRHRRHLITAQKHACSGIRISVEDAACPLAIENVRRPMSIGWCAWANDEYLEVRGSKSEVQIPPRRRRRHH